MAATTWYEIVLPQVTTLVVILVGLYLLWLGRGRVGELVHGLGLQQVSAFGVDVKFAERTAVAAYEKQGLGPPSQDDRRAIRDATAYLAPLAAQSHVLWVDDNPSNNELERATLLSWEVDVQAVRTTEEAIRELTDRSQRFDLVISDWSRRDDGGFDAGLHLLEQIANTDIAHRPRVIFYHGEVGEEELARRRERASALGAVGATGSPGELFRWVLLELARVAVDEPRPAQRERWKRAPAAAIPPS
jgi:CheY-like chemotaxis protein